MIDEIYVLGMKTLVMDGNSMSFVLFSFIATTWCLACQSFLLLSVRMTSSPHIQRSPRPPGTMAPKRRRRASRRKGAKKGGRGGVIWEVGAGMRSTVVTRVVMFGITILCIRALQC